MKPEILDNSRSYLSFLHCNVTCSSRWRGRVSRSRALSPASWHVAVVMVHVRPGGREKHQHIELMIS